MKFLVFFALALAMASAFEIPVPFREIPFGAKNSERIIGGSVAASGQFPYQVYVLHGDTVRYSVCGGSLISSSWAATAAHCVDSKPRLGRVKLGSIQCLQGIEKTYNRKNVFVHPDYDFRTIDNDIALINFATVAFSATIQPISLPEISTSYPDYVGVTVTISGCGKTSDTSGLPPFLNFAKAVAISNLEAAAFYGSIINEGKICLSNKDATSSCNGDSGGPASITDGSKHTLIGITSFGSSRGCAAGPTCYTRVDQYLDFILSTTGIQ